MFQPYNCPNKELYSIPPLQVLSVIPARCPPLERPTTCLQTLNVYLTSAQIAETSIIKNYQLNRQEMWKASGKKTCPWWTMNIDFCQQYTLALAPSSLALKFVLISVSKELSNSQFVFTLDIHQLRKGIASCLFINFWTDTKGYPFPPIIFSFALLLAQWEAVVGKSMLPLLHVK